VALLLLHLRGMVPADSEAFAQAIVASAFAVVFARLGAGVIYRLGRQVTAARELGSYLLVARLGQGGMGEVWRAEHRLIARPAAVKLMRPFREGDALAPVAEETRRRFEREAGATARLCSPHTVSLFDFGVSGDGAFYYVMELLDGMDADRLVRRHGAVPAERAIFLLKQVCHSLAEAEARGLVHRDIKPANIFVCRYGEDRDFVRVLDFGLVKAFGEAAAAGPAITRDTAIAGTPAYMAPEQALAAPTSTGAPTSTRPAVSHTGC
jgi:serine/threonine-protein kinase